MQGFNAARDRLWQIDLWRKRGLGRLAAAAALAAQTEVFSQPAARLESLLRLIEPDAGQDFAAAGQDFAAARDMLLDWDRRLGAESGPDAVFELWFTRHLKPALLAAFVPDPATRALLAPGDVEGVLTALERPDTRFGDDPVAARDGLLAGTLGRRRRDRRGRAFAARGVGGAPQARGSTPAPLPAWRRSPSGPGAPSGAALTRGFGMPLNLTPREFGSTMG